jgi:hypothetical protein
VLPDYDATVGEVRELMKAYDGKQANVLEGSHKP